MTKSPNFGISCENTGIGLSDVVTKGNHIVDEPHSFDAVRGLTTSYGFRHFDFP